MSRRHLDDLDDQIRDHLEQDIAEYIARGVPPDEARARAHRAFGNITRLKEDTRAVWVPLWLDQLRQDLAYGARLVRRQPGFYAVAVLTMALAVGATTLLAGIANGVLLKPLPWADADRLVRVTETRQGRVGRVSGTLTNGSFHAWREQRATIEDLGGWLTQISTLSGAGEALRLPVIPTTANLFAILKARPHIGRLFLDGEGRRNQPGVAVLSFGLWQERFGGRAEAVGTVVQIDDRPHTIVGVMPRDFAFPDREARVWTAWVVPPVTNNGYQTAVIFRAIGRLRPGIEPAQAAAEATARARTAPDMGLAARALFGSAGPIDIAVVPELAAITADVRPAVLALLAAAALLLVTATANIAGLQLARATTRRREMTVRAAIGAGPRRLVRQLLTENAVIGLGGGVAGLALAVVLQRWVPSVLPVEFPRLEAITIDGRVAAVAIAVSLLASAACGLLPAWQARRATLVRALGDDGALAGSGWRRTPLAHARVAIMVGQVVVACVLLIGAGLLARSVQSLTHADRGYDPANVLTARLPLPAAMPVERRGELLQALNVRLRALPGVTQAAYSTGLPLLAAGGFRAFNLRSPDDPAVSIEVQATQRVVSLDYFAAMRLRLVEGRLFVHEDTPQAAPAIVVNRTFARQYLGDRALGTRLPRSGPAAGGVHFTNAAADPVIVGVVDDTRQDGVEALPQPEMYATFAQVAADSLRFDPIVLVRTATDPIPYVPGVRALLRELAPTLAFDSVMTMEDRLASSLARPRLFAVVLAGFAAFAVAITAVGLFGVLSFTVAQRTREIGVRLALGAHDRDVAWLVLNQVLWVVGVGITSGMALAWTGTHVLSAFMYGVSAHDPLTFLLAPLVIVLVAMVSCVGPVRRALTASPLVSLRA